MDGLNVAGVVLPGLGRIPGLVTQYAWVTALASIALGLLLCFLGRRVFRVLLAVLGGVAGGTVGASLGYGWYQVLGAIGVGLVLAMVLGALLYVAYAGGVFAAGAILGGLAGWTVLAASGHPPIVPVIALVGLLSGILAMLMQVIVLIAATAVGGSLLVVSGIANLMWAKPGITPLGTALHLTRELRGGGFTGEVLWVGIAWGGLALAGTAIQFLLERRAAAHGGGKGGDEGEP